MLGARRSSPILSIEVEAGIPPLKLHFEFVTAKEYLKTLYKRNDMLESYANHRVSSRRAAGGGFAARSLSILQGHPGCLRLGCDKYSSVRSLSPQDSIEDCIDLVTKLKSQQEFERHIREFYPEYVQLFTDGSKVTEPEDSVGAALYVPLHGFVSTWRLNPMHTVISAELFAIMQALIFADQNNMVNCIICTDSRSALESILGCAGAYFSVSDRIQILLYRLSRRTKVRLIWVKAHVDIVGNIIADKAANQAHNNNMSTHYQLCLQEKINILRASFYDLWQSYWYSAVAETGKGKHLRDLRYPNFSSCSTAVIANNRRDEINIYRLRIGHAGLEEYFFRTCQSDSDLCSCGEVGSKCEHYLLYPECYDATETDFVPKYTKHYYTRGVSHRSPA